MPETVERLLTEIRDLQRQHLELLENLAKERREETARAVANQERAIRLQEEAVVRQKAFGALYRKVLVVLAIAAAAAIVVLSVVLSG